MELKDSKGNKVCVGWTPDCDENEGGYYCQVETEEGYEVDDFCVHPDDCDCTNEDEVEKYIENYIKEQDYSEVFERFEDTDGEVDFETFKEKYYQLTISQRLALYNRYNEYYGSGNTIGELDDTFFDNNFDSKLEVCRATCFGDVNFTDGYIKTNVYGNLESMTESEVLAEIESNLEEIFEYEDIWSEFIEL